jgi:hypothetical protein
MDVVSCLMEMVKLTYEHLTVVFTMTNRLNGDAFPTHINPSVLPIEELRRLLVLGMDVISRMEEFQLTLAARGIKVFFDPCCKAFVDLMCDIEEELARRRTALNEEDFIGLTEEEAHLHFTKTDEGPETQV